MPKDNIEIARFTGKDFRVNQEIEETSKKILDEEGIEINNVNVTSLDLFFIPRNLNEDQKYKLIANKLKIDQSNLVNNLPNISSLWKKAKKFYQDYFFQGIETKYIFPREIENLENFKELDELGKTLSKATILKKDDRIGFGHIYCALFKLMIAFREYEIGKFDGFMKESEYMAKKIFNESSDGNIYFHKIKDETDGWLKTLIYLPEKEKSIKTNFNFRGKNQESLIAKLGNKPEFSTEEIIKDGIGLKFEVEKSEDAKNLLVFLCQFLENNFNIQRITFENISLFEKKQLEKLKEKLNNLNVNFVSEKNPSSNKRFQAAKIVGKIKIPQDGIKGKMIIERNFEIQIVLTDNKNETGFTQHKIYKQVQRLSLFSRLLGPFNEKYLDFVCEKAQEETNISKEKIKLYIINNFLLKINSNKRKISRYIFKEHFQRWKKAELI